MNPATGQTNEPREAAAKRGQLTRPTCERLKALGYPQDHWPQMVYEGEEIFPRYLYNSPFQYTSCPTILSADGSDGVLPWLASKGWPRGHTYTLDFQKGALLTPTAGTPESLINVWLDHLEEKQP